MHRISMSKYKKPETLDGKSQPKLLMEFMRGIEQAGAAAGVIGTLLKHPEFWKISNTLRDVNILAPSIAVTSLKWAEPEMKTYMGSRKLSPPPIITDTEFSNKPTKLIL